MPLTPGTRLGPYEVVGPLGAGGMGEVYRAVDTRLNRSVAVKVLPADLAADAERRERFEREARAISALDHPHICPLFDVGRDSGLDYLVMPLLEGETLAERLRRAAGPLAVSEAVTLARQIVDGLARAHASGIIHRDLKPANVMLTKDGVRLLDFGVARRFQSTTESTVAGTRPGVVIGTVGYMSPEQVQGQEVDARSDIFAAGVLLYEMVTGRPAFSGASDFSTMSAIVSEQPPPPSSVHPGVPAAIEDLIFRCLQKDPAARPQSADELLAELRALEQGAVAQATFRRVHPAVAAAIAVTVLAVAGIAGWMWVRNVRMNKARTELIPEISRLAEIDSFRALELFNQAEALVPDDPRLASLRPFVAIKARIETDPPGARAFLAPYLGEERWTEIGTTPVDYTAPFGQSRLRFEKDGFVPLEVGQSASGVGVPGSWTLPPTDKAPDGMVFVPGGRQRYTGGSEFQLANYWLDRHEVTNRQFKAFVDAGGYRRPDMQRFTDSTARPGPAAWEIGSYPEGTADHPVTGISWHEAAAYCEFAGKSLPTIHHWSFASGIGYFTEILRASNFGTAGPAPVGKYRGVGPYGTFDMAGNVKEWVSNATGDRRYLLGGAWSEPPYMFHDVDARPAAERAATHGVRCARYTAPLEAALLAPIERRLAHDYSKQPPVAAGVVEAYVRRFAYDAAPLDARIEQENTKESWRQQTVSIATPYGERMRVRLYLPVRGKPPFPTVIFFPGSYAETLADSSTLIDEWFFDFIMRSGRAVAYPTYKGMYERRVAGVRARSNQWTEIRIAWGKDLRRTIDYLESRADIDRNRIGFYGVSMGASYGPVLVAVEPRIRTAIFAGGGLHPTNPPDEVNAFSYAPRIKAPVLMLNTKDDFLFPVEASQRPLFELLGTPPEQKKHIVQEVGGHIPRRTDIARHILDWLDRWFGAVTP